MTYSFSSSRSISSDDLALHQRQEFLLRELDNVLLPHTPRGILSDRPGILSLSIEALIQDTINQEIVKRHDDFDKRFNEASRRLSRLEEQILADHDIKPPKTPRKNKSPRSSPVIPAPLSPTRFLTPPNKSIASIRSSKSHDSGKTCSSPTPSSSKPCSSSELFREAAKIKAQQHLSGQSDLLDIPNCADSFHFELGFGNTYKTLHNECDDLSLIDGHLDENFYLANFFGIPQTQYYLPEDAPGSPGPVIISVLETTKCEALGLVRSQFGNKRIKLVETGKKKRLAELLSQAALPPETNLFALDDESLTQRLIALEHISVNEHRQYKFGVLLAHDHQTEDEMFANDTTPAFENFVSFLGAKIELQGWHRFRAGLDTKHGTTGTYSVYQQYQNHQIMFHVSTFLPKEPMGSQQLERKRHLGNDICVIIFHDGKEPFNPTLIRSHFNCCFLIVREVLASTTTLPVSPLRAPDLKLYQEPNPEHPSFYQFAFAVRKDAPLRTMKPYVPSPPIFPNNRDSLLFLLVKLINAERGTMHAPEFRERNVKTQRLLLSSIIDEVCKDRGISVK